MIDAFHFGKLQSWTAGRPEVPTKLHKPQGMGAREQSPGLFAKLVAAVGGKRTMALLQGSLLERDKRQQLDLEKKSTRVCTDLKRTVRGSAGRLLS